MNLQIIHLKKWLTLLLLMATCGYAAAETVVIANPADNISELSKGELKSIFLGKKDKLPNGVVTLPVNQPEGTDIHGEFITKVLRKSPEKLKAYWASRIFSGKGQPPKEHADDVAIRTFVSQTSGGLGYIDASNLDDSVIVVYRVK